MSDELIIRAPNHLGDLVMALPALAGVPDADVLVRTPLAPLVALAKRSGRILTLGEDAGGFLTAVRDLRRGNYRRGVLLTPSFSAALLFLAGGVRERRGTATDFRTALLTDAIPLDALDGMHRGASYTILVGGGEHGDDPERPRLEVPPGARKRWRELDIPEDARPIVGVVPGSRASARRWDAGRWVGLVRRLTGRGLTAVVFGAPDERDLAARVAGEAAFNAGGRTDLVQLAAGLAACDLVVGSDSGAVHLAAAVGTPTVSLWGAGDPAITRAVGAEHRRLRRAELPCVPCVKNECPRRGAGTVLPRADRECMRLIGVEDVDRIVRERLRAVC